MNHFFLLTILVILITVGKTATQNYTIERNFSNSHGDKFTIPKALCDTIKSNDKCKGFGAEALPQTSCKCQCPAFRPAFLNIGNDSRRCLDDEAFRKRQGCGIFVLQQTPDSNIPIFQGENFADQLQHISSGDDCKMDVTSSKFLQCDGTWAPISSTRNSRFEILKQSGEFLIMVRKTPNSPNVDGRIIRIAITCVPQGSPAGFTKPCLLFKLHGKFECPVKVESQLRTTASTANITTANGIASNSTTKTGVGIKVKPTTINFDFGKRESDADSIVPIAFGLGVLGIIVLVVLCIVLVVLINRHRENSEMKRNYRRYSDDPAVHDEVTGAKQSDKETFGLEMYGNNTNRKSDKNNDAEILLKIAKVKEAKDQEERYKTSMGETNEWCDGDSAYNTIRTSDSPSTSEGVEFDRYSIPRKSNNKNQSSEEEVIEAEFRLSAEIPAIYDVPNSGSASSIPNLNKTSDNSIQTQNLFDVPGEDLTLSAVPITKVPPLRLTIDSTTQQQPYVPIVVLDSEAAKSFESRYDTPEQVIDLEHVHHV